MKIVRNGMSYELTPAELLSADEEQQHAKELE